MKLVLAAITASTFALVGCAQSGPEANDENTSEEALAVNGYHCGNVAIPCSCYGGGGKHYLPVGGPALSSPNGRANLIFQTDGNLVVYDEAWQPRWYTNTFGANDAVFQSDGNFVVYSGSTPVWHSQTWNFPNSWLCAQDDGNVVIYYNTQGGRYVHGPVWDTRTYH